MSKSATDRLTNVHVKCIAIYGRSESIVRDEGLTEVSQTASYETTVWDYCDEHNFQDV